MRRRRGAASATDDLLCGDVLGRSGAALIRTVIAQPAVFALQVSLLALWRSWGIEPVAALGHSLGEYAAAYAAGIMSLEDAMRVVVARGRGAAHLQGGHGGGRRAREVMASAIRAEIGDLEIAGHNGPQSFVVSGRPEAVAALAAGNRDSGRSGEGSACSLCGSHSRWVEPAMPRLATELRRRSRSIRPASRSPPT